ncbi:Oligoribonuclease NrnB or cAMP/cGMP phosphodiesterase, DHH superfamily [Mameliella alba]|uniref:phosphohydrolase n=1 Tax=Mameliella alba TaxID=561184 RepID=UPI0008850B2C|nr:phosphohydrolase [Mameliella alba]OWV46484.1 phosphohydrolase [Mameliella alba]PTR37295.1 oligoribonuclease NrnB/cAMP/cGMP phosphodiesterase (DHH superfamily) [Mameliella alba]GGF73609.1 hypothetical protein GCM10011319_37660 [Mameliella alba]SDD76549.1 Oligoribonuclease NrnB or cAMP/cGMP phosphodiesterase, DHH superfamily [Mameliella alba]
MTRTICIYHANCADGFTAAWAVRCAFRGQKVDFIPASYGSEPPKVAGANVLIVDFSYPRKVLERMAKSARSILVLDHHKTAEAELAGMDRPAETWAKHVSAAGNPAVLFDMERSGAQMAWDYLHRTARPPLVDYVADRDLWRWQMQGSREINAVIQSLEQDFANWDALAHRLKSGPAPSGGVIQEGEAILRVHDKLVRQVIDVTRRNMVIGGHVVPVANGPYALASDVAGTMAEGAPFAANYVDGPDGRAFSLRSRADGVDVSEIAASYGGGGHRGAAGFLAARGWEGDDATNG